MVFFGDGATNEGAFHEALNMASIWKLPIVFVCENNKYAMSMDIALAMAVEHVAQRAAAYAMPGTAIDGNDQLAPFSQRQSYVALAAPGVDVPSTAWAGAGRGLYASQSGTSIAAPHVSGAAAILWALRPDLAAADIVTALRSSADKVTSTDPGYGAGILNVAHAIASSTEYRRHSWGTTKHGQDAHATVDGIPAPAFIRCLARAAALAASV